LNDLDEVEHAEDDIVTFDHDEDVESIECFEGLLIVECTSKMAAHQRAAEWKTGTLLAASRGWNCTDKNGKKTVVLARLIATKQRGSFVEIKTKPAGYHVRILLTSVLSLLPNSILVIRYQLLGICSISSSTPRCNSK
jgi:hypothetical protein